MAQLTLKLQTEGKNEAESGRLAADLRKLIREGLPEASVTFDRTDPDAQEAGSLLVVALAHIAVTAFIEVVKTYWELRPGTYVKIQAKDGTTMSFQGATPEFERVIKNIAETVKHEPERPKS